MDAIAKEGVRFTNGYSSGCICSPGRVGLMTGRYKARTGHDANPAKPGRELLLSEVTIAQRLKAAGYHTGIVGKWHLGDAGPEFMPMARGFDFAMGTTGNLGEGGIHPFYRGGEMLKEMDGAPITSPIFAREACTYIESQKISHGFYTCRLMPSVLPSSRHPIGWKNSSILINAKQLTRHWSVKRMKRSVP